MSSLFIRAGIISIGIISFCFLVSVIRIYSQDVPLNKAANIITGYELVLGLTEIITLLFLW